MKSGTSRLLWIAGALLFLVLALVAWLQVGPLLDPEVDLVASPRGACALRAGPCEAAFPDGSRVVFEMLPHHIPVMEKLRVVVRTEGFDAHRVEVDFSGVDMNMGFNRATLEASGPGEHTGTLMLPACVRSRMTWEARVLLDTDAGLLAAPFRFDTYLPGREPRRSESGQGPE